MSSSNNFKTQEKWVKERQQINDALQSEIDWLVGKDFSDWGDALFVTLSNRISLKYENEKGIGFKTITLNDTQQNLRHWYNLLNRKVYGKDFKNKKKGLRILPVTERTRNGDGKRRIHHHLIIEKPEHYDTESFYVQILLNWEKTRYGIVSVKHYDEVRNKVVHIPVCNMQEIYDMQNLKEYVLKARTKLSVDDIDIQNAVFH